MKQDISTLQKRLQTGCRFVDAHPRWVPTDNLHVTLAFLGMTPDSRIPELANIADQVVAGAAPFELEISRVELFPPNTKQPRVISVGISSEKRALVKFQKSLAERLLEAEFGIDQRSYKPHLTLARLPSIKTASRVAPVVAAHSTALAVKFQVADIVLFESVSSPGGPQYVPLHTVKLKV